LEKDTAFESVVVDAQFNVDEGKWHVKTADGRTARSRFLIVAAGFAAKR
jgi:cation diffusion facilitator CzcD-associated flavoprotein CzcO